MTTEMTAAKPALTFAMLLANQERLKVQNAKQYVVGFGKYSGKTLEQIVVADRRYATWLGENSYSDGVRQYIKLVLEAIPAEQCVVSAPVEAAKPATAPEMVVITFGKYKGKTIGQVSEIELSYLNWLSTKSTDAVLKEAAMVVYKVKKSTERADRKAAKQREAEAEKMAAEAAYNELLQHMLTLFVNRVGTTPYIANYDSYATNGGRLNSVIRVLPGFEVASTNYYGTKVPQIIAQVENIENNQVVSVSEKRFTFSEADTKWFEQKHFCFESLAGLQGNYYLELDLNGTTGIVYDINTQKQAATVTLSYQNVYYQWCPAEHPGYWELQYTTFTLADGTTVKKFPGSIEGYLKGGLWE